MYGCNISISVSWCLGHSGHTFHPQNTYFVGNFTTEDTFFPIKLSFKNKTRVKQDSASSLVKPPGSQHEDGWQRAPQGAWRAGVEADGLSSDPSSDPCWLWDPEEKPQPFWASRCLVCKEETELPAAWRCFQDRIR